MTKLKRNWCMLTWSIVFIMTSTLANAEDLYLIRFLSGKEVVFELTPNQARIVDKAEGKVLMEIPAQTKLGLAPHIEGPYVGLGNAKWIKGEELAVPLLGEEEHSRYQLLSNGTVYDKAGDQVLILSCQGSIKTFAIRESIGRLVIVNREVTRYFHDGNGKVIGAAFSGEDELTFVQFTGEVTTRIPLKSIGFQLLDIEGSTVIPVIHSAYSTNWSNPLNWFRSLAGHPRQTQRVFVSIFDLSGLQIDSRQIAELERPEEFKLYKIVR